MRTLLLVQDFGPAEAMILNALQARGENASVYDVRGRWILGGAFTPFWLQGYRLGHSALAAGYMSEFIRAKGVNRVIASGLEACAFAAKGMSEPWTPLLWRTDLDFSAKRQHKVDAFERLTVAAERLLLEDEWEMDKAGAKGSAAAHLRMPQPRLAPQPMLSRTGKRPRVVVLHPAAMAEERLGAYLHSFRQTVPDAEFEAVQVESMYRWRDAERQRDLQEIMSFRLADYSHVAFLGISRHHSVVLEALRADWDRVSLEETIGGGALARAAGFSHVARGVRLANLVGEQVVGAERAVPDGTAAAPAGTDFIERLATAMARPVEPGHEDLAGLSGEGPLQVFFSTAPLQDRTNGARPQRIRNMAEAYDQPTPAVRLFSSGPGFHRRLRLVQDELRRGRPAGFFYGENSTTPIESLETIHALGGFLEDFRAAGGKSAWFVRDLHWLDQIDGYLDHPELRDEVTQRGLAELDSVGGRSDVLFAPCAESGEGFNQLLRGAGREGLSWEALPPAVAASNVATPRGENPDDGRITLLYAGGSNSVYGMDTFLSSFTALEPTAFVLDFVVRVEEVGFLQDALERHGLRDDERVRIIHTELEHYLPRTNQCFGTILLDSEYAKFSFPYKTVSMIERGFPIIAYRDMAIADFVTSNGVGAVCERDASSLAATLEAMRAADFGSALAQAQSADTWEARAERVRSLLA